MDKKLFDFLEKYKLTPRGCSEKCIKNRCGELYEELMKYPSYLSMGERIYWYVYGLKERPRCVCGKEVSFNGLVKGYLTYCSYRCVALESREKIKSTKKERYGDEKYNNREKAKKTSIERFGSENIFSSKEGKEKIKKYYIDKYGVDHPSKVESIQEKKIRNNLDKYGVKYSVQREDVKEKIRKGVQEYKIDNTPGMIGFNENGERIFRCTHKECTLCNEKQFTIPSINYFARRQFGIELCTKLLPIKNERYENTYIEQAIRRLLEEYHIEYQTNVRNIIAPKELDIYIPSKKIAIECNGCYFHSNNLVDKNYHKDKFLSCQKQGIQLLTIWEDQIVNKIDIVKSIILSKLGIYQQRLYARKCEVREVSSKEAMHFLLSNHIQGKTNTKARLGLYFDNQLVSLMTFNLMSKLSGGMKKDVWELNRFCTKLNTQVIGGAEKLLTHFMREHKSENLVSFASNDISNGSLYEKLGFAKESSPTPSYWYVQRNTFIRFHRTSFSKTRLREMGYDTTNKTEEEVMSSLPYYKIYDSGHTKYTFNKQKVIIDRK